MTQPRQITPEAHARARTFLQEQARPLESALYDFHFEGGSNVPVLACLAGFQNEDGGYGNALESDLRAPESSAIATSVALRILREVGCMDHDPLATRALLYLREQLNPALSCWRIVPETTDASPHAPWWQQAGRDVDYDTFGLNPTAELLGYLYDRADLFPETMLAQVTSAVMESLATQPTLEMHDLLCVLRLFTTTTLPDSMRDTLEPLLRSFIGAAVTRDRAAWEQYGLRPLQVVEAPGSSFASGMEDALSANLDYMLDEQDETGAWMPTWSWGDLYPDVWPVARQEWAGVLTLANLHTLKRFGRITPSSESPAV